VFAAIIAVGQYDIKRILAYSTVSQLGYMMMGIGVGGAAVGMFHLITHAFFKALLFLGAGSVIHGCNGEQDIRKMGGLRKLMPVTFAAYTAGMLALCGLPLVVSGFWSKDAILHAASEWSVTQVPFYLGTIGALLTAFYMTRQMAYVFAGSLRLPQDMAAHGHGGHGGVHESPAVMTVPLVILAVFAVGLGFIGTPAWPWFQSFLNGEHASFAIGALTAEGMLRVMASSSVIVLVGLGAGWWIYGKRGIGSAEAPDAVGAKVPGLFAALGSAFYVDALYDATIVRLCAFAATLSAWLDRWVWGGAVRTVSGTVSGLAHMDRFVDEQVVNGGFDEGCESVTVSGMILSLLQGGRVQNYMRSIGAALVILAGLLLWGSR
jgi:NADH-quinone oxidoreductase subunit L